MWDRVLSIDQEYPPGMLGALLECLTEAVALLDHEGRVLAGNPALIRLTGRVAADPPRWWVSAASDGAAGLPPSGGPGRQPGSQSGTGAHLEEFFTGLVDSSPVEAVLAEAREDGAAEGRARRVNADGSECWLRYRLVRLPACGTARPVPGDPVAASPDGACRASAMACLPSSPEPCFLAVMEEVTGEVERQLAQSLSRRLLEEACRREATLTHLNRELAALNQLAATVNQSLELNTVLEVALEQALEVAEASTGWVFLRSSEVSEELELAAQRGLPADYTKRNQRSRLRDSLPGKTVLTGKPLVLYSLPADDEMTPYLRRQEVRCVAHIPLRNRERTIGAMGIGAPGISQFSEGIIRFLTSVGHQVGLAIENARLYTQVKQRADLDPLTGLYNRQRFCELLDARVAALRGTAPDEVAAARDARPWVVMFDIDNFKQINDSFGHDRGDQVLREVARFLRQCIRGSDLAARYGGDEFVFALCGTDGSPETPPSQRAEAVVERLRLAFEEANRAGRFTVPLAVSIGAACTGPSSEDCLKRADEAMYREKRRRKRAAARERSAARDTATAGPDQSGEPIAALRAAASGER